MCETTDVIRGGTLNKVLVHPLGCLPAYGNGLHAMQSSSLPEYRAIGLQL